MFKLTVILLLLTTWFCGVARPDIQEVKITGTIDLDILWRNNYRDFDDQTKDQPAYSELEINLPVVAKFTENVSLEVELEEGAGSDGINRSNGADSKNIGFLIDEAFITCKEFVWDKLTVQIGKMPLRYNLRGKTGRKSLRRNNGWIIEGADATGVFLQVELAERTAWDFFWLKLGENSKATSNTREWARHSGTGNSDDQDLFGTALTHYWNDTNMLRGMLATNHDNASNSSVKDVAGNQQKAGRELYVFTLGSDCFVYDKTLEFYSELGYQWGKYDAPANLDFGALGGVAGVEYTFNRFLKPYLGVELFYLGGESGNHVQWQDFDSEYATTLIFESDNQDAIYPNGFETGGYFRSTILGGFKQLPHNFRLDLLASHFLDTDKNSRNVYGEQIGWETDMIWTWHYTKDLRFEFGLAWFFVDEDYARNGGSQGRNKYNPAAPHDDAWLAVWNTTISF